MSQILLNTTVFNFPTDLDNPSVRKLLTKLSISEELFVHVEHITIGQQKNKVWKKKTKECLNTKF